MTESQEPERRGSQRLHAPGRARVLLRPARVVDVDMIDISEAGVCLTSPVELAPGTWCHLRIELSPSGTDLSVSGQVCFCIERQGAFRVGVHCPHSESLAAAVRGIRPHARGR
jgi:hypothetical protein